MSTLSVNTSFNISLQFTSAPGHIRIFAWIIDGFIIGIYQWVSGMVAEGIFGASAQEGGIDYMLYIPVFVYHLLFEILNHGQSPGKMAVGIRVVSADGREETNAQAMVRWLMRTIDFGGLIGIAIMIVYEAYFMGSILIASNLLAFILFLTTKYNQRLGDMAAGTVVVYKKLPYNISDTIFRELNENNYEVRFPQVMKLSDNDMNIIDNVVKRHRKADIEIYLNSVAEKVKTALEIETDLDDYIFLECLLNDYNYLSRK